eukprot:1410674-Rhodomonas_salina.1
MGERRLTVGGAHRHMALQAGDDLANRLQLWLCQDCPSLSPSQQSNPVSFLPTLLGAPSLLALSLSQRLQHSSLPPHSPQSTPSLHSLSLISAVVFLPTLLRAPV